jgi:integrase
MPQGNYRTSGTSVYRRAGRKYYYISYRDPLRPDRYRIHEATPFLVSDPEGMRKANALAQEKAGAIRISGDGAQVERWESWVLPFLEHQYAESPLTLRIYKTSWRWVSLFLIREAHVRVPRALTYAHIRAYHQWRTNFKKVGGRQASGNTALGDIKALSVVMNEAVNRGWAPSNPALRVRIPKGKVRHARELSAEELALIEARLPAWVADLPETRTWMLAAYQIGRYQGCRLRETRLNLRTQVNLHTNTLTFLVKGRKKGDGEMTAMHPRLRPLFEAMIARGDEWTLDYGNGPSLQWRKFLDSIGLRDAWFHCLRSTVITEMARAGVPISQAMRYVLHANEEIHRAYQRLTTSDLTAAHGAIGGAAPVQASSGIQVALIAELMRGGMTAEEAMRRVLHGATPQTPPAAVPTSAADGDKPA